jgi:hypothetical protein
MIFVAVFTWHAAFVQAERGGQSPRSAIVEAWTNIAIGFSINYVVNLILLPVAFPGLSVGAATNWWLGWTYTAVSILRQYAIRRWFNARLSR